MRLAVAMEEEPGRRLVAGDFGGSRTSARRPNSSRSRARCLLSVRTSCSSVTSRSGRRRRAAGPRHGLASGSGSASPVGRRRVRAPGGTPRAPRPCRASARPCRPRPGRAAAGRRAVGLRASVGRVAMARNARSGRLRRPKARSAWSMPATRSSSVLSRSPPRPRPSSSSPPAGWSRAFGQPGLDQDRLHLGLGLDVPPLLLAASIM